MPRVRLTARAAEIRRFRAEGMTLDAIGKQFNISRERVRQILDAPPRPRRPEHAQETSVLTDRAVRGLFLTLGSFEVTARLFNVLKRERLFRLGDVVRLSLRELRDIKGLGMVSIGELEKLASQHELGLGLHIPRWPPLFPPVGCSWARQLLFGGDQSAVESLDVAIVRQILDLPSEPVRELVSS
jgi:hypothetical protein